jgi:hypothetical protein
VRWAQSMQIFCLPLEPPEASIAEEALTNQVERMIHLGHVSQPLHQPPQCGCPVTTVLGWRPCMGQ